jgi:thiamine-monophosphate kinase
VPETLTGQYFQNLVAGFLKECARVDMPLIGGDLSRNAAVVVSVTALGYVDTGDPITRSGAKEGDSLLLIGKTGYSRLGLDYLRSSGGTGLAEISDEEALRDWAGSPHRYEWLKAHFLPEVHLEAAVWIREMGLANSMIDVSDGLGHDLRHILEESQLSCEMQIERLPCPSGVRRVEEARRYALTGGEDYALLLTVSGEQLSELERSYPPRFPPYTVIGRLSSGPVNLSIIDGQGQPCDYESEGFSHF